VTLWRDKTGARPIPRDHNANYGLLAPTSLRIWQACNVLLRVSDNLVVKTYLEIFNHITRYWNAKMQFPASEP
jgi:hypothetical protein